MASSTIPDQSEASAREWLSRLRDGLAALIVCVVVGAGLGFAYSTRQESKYAATGTILVTPQTGLLDVQNADKLPAVTETLVRLARSKSIMSAISVRWRDPSTGARRSAGWVSQHLTIAEVANLGLISVEGTGPSSTAAASLATVASDQIVRSLNGLARTVRSAGPQTPTAAQPQGVILKRFGGIVSGGKVSPTVVTDIVIGANAGLLVGVVAALVIGSLYPRVRSLEDLMNAVPGPVIGRIRTRGRSVSRRDRGIGEATSYLIAHEQDETGVILLVGVKSDRLFSAVCAALAASVATSERTVIVVDCDLSRRTFSRTNGLSREFGIADSLQHDTDYLAVESLPISGDNDTMDVLPAGRPVSNGDALVRSRRLGDMISRLREQYDYVFLIGPPIRDRSTVISLLHVVDGSLLVARSGQRISSLTDGGTIGEGLREKQLGSLYVG